MKPANDINKPSRVFEDALKALLQSNAVSTQEEIKHALKELGFAVNQSKISRALHKLGAVKTPYGHGQTVYTLPLEPAPPTSKSILSQLITGIKMNEHVIVLHTNPGSASLIGRLIDHHREQLDVIGTVAGDDTLFIAPRSTKYIAKTLQAIQTFFAESLKK